MTDSSSSYIRGGDSQRRRRSPCVERRGRCCPLYRRCGGSTHGATPQTVRRCAWCRRGLRRRGFHEITPRPGLRSRIKASAGLAVPAPKDYGTRHGVYVSREGRCSQYLQKASPAELERAGAVVDDKVARLDSGVVFFDVATSKNWYS